MRIRAPEMGLFCCWFSLEVVFFFSFVLVSY